jgi:Glycosyltransferase 61
MNNKFYRLLGRLLGKPLRFGTYAQDAITLCPQEEQEISLSVYLPEHLHRVTGVAIHSVLATVMESLRQTHVVHAPCLMFPIGKTRLFGGGLWTHKNQFFRRKIKEADEFKAVNLPNALVTDSDIGLDFFGHWMRDVAPSNLVATSEIPSLSLRRPDFAHAAQYEQFFQLKTIYGNKGQVDNLFLLSDFSQNSFKHKRYLTLRDNLKGSINPPAISYSGVFIARGQTGTTRALANEDEVIAHLEKKGFDVIYPEKMVPEEIIKRLWGAKIVITVEGSAHNHAIYSMALNGALLTLEPPNRFGTVIKGACDCLGIGWGFYVCAPANDGQGFYVDSFADLDRVADKLLSSR